MKNLLFFLALLAITALLSFKLCIKNKSKNVTKGWVTESLNGVDQSNATATNEINDFQSNYYLKAKLPKVGFWLDINVVKEIVKLINDEIKIQVKTGAMHFTDGIRIYFVHDAHSKYGTSLILVTTVDSIDAIDNRTQRHHDYYLHPDTEQLFSDNKIAGTYSSYNDRKQGERLFTGMLTGADAGCVFGSANPSYVKTNDAYLMVTSFGKDFINTCAEWYPTASLQSIINEGSRCVGLRIYEVRHPQNSPSEFVNRDGFIMTTTESDPNDSSDHQDYFDCNSNSLPTKSHGAGKGAKGIIYDKLPPQNNGSLCPLNCN